MTYKNLRQEDFFIPAFFMKLTSFMLNFVNHENKRAFYELSSLLIAIYCSAILGEYITEALVIKHYTVKIIPSLYKFNAVLLFLVTIFLFFAIDRFHRCSLVKVMSVSYFVSIFAISMIAKKFYFLVIVLYGISYVSKISMFGLFWIIANDICDTRKSKNIFPLTAGFGLIGGVLSTILSGKIIYFVHVENLLWLWAALFIPPFFIMNYFFKRYNYKLSAEKEVTNNKTFKEEFSQIVNEKTIRIISIIYFFIFIILFNMDFIFTKALSFKYTDLHGFDAERFVAFKFNIYLIVSFVIILFHFIYTSDVSKKIGVTNSMLILPVLLGISFLTILFFKINILSISVFILFYIITGFYMLRQFSFEALFSTNYQIFFSALSRRFRGKGRFFLEGLIKPLGITFAGILIMLNSNEAVYYSILILISVASIGLIIYLKKEYSKILLKEEYAIPKDNITKMIKSEICGKNKNKILSLIFRVIDSQDYDLKRVAIRYLESLGTDEAFGILRKKFFEESDRIKEMIAASLSTFDSIEARGFLRQLLEDKNSSVISGALLSIRKNVCMKPQKFDLKKFIYESDTTIFEESVKLVYDNLKKDEKDFVHDKIKSFSSSNNLEEKICSIKLIGFIRGEWLYDILIKNMSHNHYKIWKESVNSILMFNKEGYVQELLGCLDEISNRSKKNYIINKLGNLEIKYIKVFEQYFLKANKKRTAFYIISILRLYVLRLSKDHNLKKWSINKKVKEKIFYMAMNEIKNIYLDVYKYYDLIISLPLMHKKIALLKQALYERRKRFSMFVIDMLSILDDSGALLYIERNFKKLEEREKANIIELIEAFGERNISRYLIPILEDYKERELLKIGSHKWLYKPNSFDKSLDYFIKSDNKWIESIALYLKHEAYKNAA